MRVVEIASAEDQLALWKLVSDNVWSAIAAQADQERRANAEKAARSKSKRGKRRSSPKLAKPPASPPKAPLPLKPQDPKDKATPKAAALGVALSLGSWGLSGKGALGGEAGGLANLGELRRFPRLDLLRAAFSALARRSWSACAAMALQTLSLTSFHRASWSSALAISTTLMVCTCVV